MNNYGRSGQSFSTPMGMFKHQALMSFVKPPVQEQPWTHRNTMIVDASLAFGKNTSPTSQIGLPSLSTRPRPCTGWKDRPVSENRLLLKHAPKDLRKLDTLVLHSSWLSTNTLIPHACSLPLLNNSQLRFPITVPLLNIGFSKTTQLLRGDYLLNSNHCWLLSRFRSLRNTEREQKQKQFL